MPTTRAVAEVPPLVRQGFGVRALVPREAYRRRGLLSYSRLALLFSLLLPVHQASADLIVGTVQSPAGLPVPGVIVSATHVPPDLKRHDDSTDASGAFSINVSGSGSGTYNVSPSKSGYTFTPTSRTVTVTIGGLDTNANFTADAYVPAVLSQSSGPVGATNATLNATVNPDGAATTAWFDYGLTTTYGTSTTPTSVGSDTSSHNVAVAINGLAAATMYHFRVVASNSFGVTAGPDTTFTTPTGIAAITTQEPTAGSSTSMTLQGRVTPNGAASSAWFEWGVTTNYGNSTAAQSFGSGGFFGQVVAGLQTGASYHYRAVAGNSFGTNFGADASFTPIFEDIGAGLTGAYAGSATWADYDFDGNLDLLLVGAGNAGTLAEIWRNTGAGFSKISAPLTGLAYSSAAWADYNNDGWPDVIVCGLPNLGGPITQLWRNTGVGFASVSTLLPSIYGGSIAWGDYDNDGRPDILLSGTTNSGIGAITQIWRNNGTDFSNINAGLPGLMDSSVAWGDFDNDGKLDLAICGYSSSGLVTQVWRSTGNGFSNINAGITGIFRGTVAWGDFDNDGRLDLLIAGQPNGSSGGVTQIWRNTGNGFSNINAGITGFRSGSAAWGDFDNDGRLDIVLTGLGPGLNPATQVWRNTGSGFVNIGAGLPGVSQGVAAWGDYDNDGRLDLVISGTTNDSPSGVITRIYRNNFPTTNNPPAPPSNLSAAVAGTGVTLTWNGAADLQTPAPGLNYNLRVGTAPGAQDVIAPMAASSGVRRVPQKGNAETRSQLQKIELGRTYYWTVQAIDTAFAGSAFAPEQHFTINTVLTPPNGVPVAGDLNGDGVVDQSELNIVLLNYFPNSAWLYITNTAGLGTTNVQFALTNFTAWDLSVLVSTNLADWDFLGLAQPMYQFSDPAAATGPQRYYRLRWP